MRKRIDNCNVDNCIPTPASCVTWNCGDMEFLGICDGDPLCNVIWELADKVKQFSVDDLEDFDVASLAGICGNDEPLEVTTLSILNLLKDNQICLKDFIDTLNEKIDGISTSLDVNANLKCYASSDNLGNTLSITRDSFDQLVIDNLCNHKQRIENIEGEIVVIKSQLENLDLTPAVEEVFFGTCINPAVLPASTQIQNTSTALCNYIGVVGSATEIAVALALTPADLNAEFGLIAGWTPTPTKWIQNYGNLLIEVENLRQRIHTIEETCCAITCDDVQIGFSAVFSDENTITLRFTAGAGTNIPEGWTSSGSSVTITDKNEDTVTENIIIDNNSEHDISILGLDTSEDFTITVTSVMTNGSLVCERCLIKKVSTTGACDFCQICVEGTEGTVVIVYEDETTSVTTSFNPKLSVTTTTTSL